MKHKLLGRVYDEGVVAIIRADRSDGLNQIAQAILAGGVSIMEVTMTTPNALEAIQQIATDLEDQIVIGVGSVLDAETARLSILAGAQFIVTPVLDIGIIRMANRYGIPVMMGCYSPTEVKVAMENGADVIKLFPATHGGIAYLKAIRAPLPQAQFIPTGGINLDNAADWLAAGVFALGIGSALVDSRLVLSGDFAEITRRATAFREIVNNHRLP
ncbi:MAG: bifunctional 4-hydroxy-2-oxoglutarate aldolase/2-dehydro-3-deoxy-phosphogluconate aldolase [Chloroflexota bacterium]